MDVMITTEIFQKLGIEVTDYNLSHVQARTEEIYKETFDIPTVCPGILEILEYLTALPNVTIGIASGNFPGVAWIKLEAAGLLKYFPDRIGGLGSVQDRKDAVLQAIHNGEQLKGVTFDVKMHVGDTPNDVDAALRAGVIPLAVLTGKRQFAKWPDGINIVNNLIEGRQKFLTLLNLI